VIEIPTPDAAVRAEVKRRLDAKTKPRRSLGRLEDLAAEVAAIQGKSTPSVARKAIVVMAGDHGVAAEGVSAYPPEVTRQMLLNFAAGGAAVCVLARQAGARLMVVDMGCREPVEGVVDRRLGAGTASITKGPAMSLETARNGVEHGIRIARELAGQGVGVIGLGDMGIGNTTSSSALAAAFLGGAVEELVGRGTGIDDAGFERKTAAVKRALEVNRPDPKDALGTLAKLGGFEIAGLAGVALGAAASRVPVIVDGLIATAAALAAVRIAPEAKGALLPSHLSVERAHGRMLASLGLRPLFDLEMRLGEGTGAALAMHLVEAALRILDEMATFASAGVSDTGK
jgi:nicotinate-nucleotide--dimethylbenzimidazole phosphoribosyltransferase